MTDDTATLKELIDGLDDTIGMARRLADPFAVRLLEMARLQLLMQHHGIKEGELETFCEALTEDHVPTSGRRAIIMGESSPRRARRGRAKLRAARHSAAPATT